MNAGTTAMVHLEDIALVSAQLQFERADRRARELLATPLAHPDDEVMVIRGFSLSVCDNGRDVWIVDEPVRIVFSSPASARRSG